LAQQNSAFFGPGMKNFTLTILTIFCTLSLGFTAGTVARSSESQGVVANNAAPPSVRIVAPQPGAALQQDGVQVRYQVQPAQNTPVPPSPNFLVRLDGRDPVQTQDTETTFTGLQPGKHTVTVDLVDANGIAIAGSRTQVEFTILAQARPGRTQTPSQSSPQSTRPNVQPPKTSVPLRIDPALKTASLDGKDAADQKCFSRSLHRAAVAAVPEVRGAAAPLLSCIGAGVVLGGLASARITRRR
jgi:Penicillin-Binding Protein C-terminus Family